MKNIKKLKTIAIVIVLCGIGFIFYATIHSQNLIKKIEQQKLSANNIDNYLNSIPTSSYVNTEAEESFLLPNYQALEDDIKHTYYPSAGPTMLSNTDQWDQTKLKALYEELMQNQHGEEMNSLYKVYVHGEASQNAAADHLNSNEKIDFKIVFPAIPDSCKIQFKQVMGTINLYDGDQYTTIDSMAFVLSHEYGHHYTFYYMFDDDTTALESEYAKLRQIPGDKVEIVRSAIDDDYYINNHHWYLQEIAADDYVQLMGSPTAKKIINYSDINDILHGASSEWTYYSINGTPQENFLIPLAYETEGLYDYYYSFIDSNLAMTTHQKIPITITIQRKSKYHELINGSLTCIYYEITWDKVYGEDVVYTLVYYDPDNYDYVMPLKTVYSNQSALAYLGHVSYETSMYVYSQNDELATGKKTFVVTATFPDGTIYKSDPVEYNFD